MWNIKYILLGSLMAGFLFSCKKTKPDNPVPPVNIIDFSITYKVDNDFLTTNVNKYINQAGNHYSISKLEYYLSQLNLIKADSSLVFVKDYQYIDATLASTNQITFKNIPTGNYIGIKFNIGLDSLHNITDLLPPSVENINMVWPDMMGGGYHFMKMEGYFLDSANASYGYAMHLGTNACLIPIRIFKNFTVTAESNFPLTAVMNINEWYKNPNIFDFNKDGNYIMGNMMLMKKIANNGTDVFSF